MSELAKWYVIHTYSGYENKVAQSIETVIRNRNLNELIQSVVVPTETVTEITQDKKGNPQSKVVERKTYPGYVLLKMIYTDDTWHIVKSIRGVTGFVGPDSKPTPVSEKEIKAMGIGVVKEEQAPLIEVDYAVGDTVRIVGTVMDGLSGPVQDIDIANGTVTVLIAMIGHKPSGVTVNLNQVVKV
jgi:transcriptional antiterminator NusG